MIGLICSQPDGRAVPRAEAVAACSCWPSGIAVFRRGARGDLLLKWWDGTRWSDYAPSPESPDESYPAVTMPAPLTGPPAAGSWGGGTRLDVFARGPSEWRSGSQVVGRLGLERIRFVGHAGHRGPRPAHSDRTSFEESVWLRIVAPRRMIQPPITLPPRRHTSSRRHCTRPQITTDNVANLRIVWAFATGLTEDSRVGP